MLVRSMLRESTLQQPYPFSEVVVAGKHIFNTKARARHWSI
jgi:hypothetical protein